MTDCLFLLGALVFTVVEWLFDLVTSDILLVEVIVDYEVVRKVESFILGNCDSLSSRVSHWKKEYCWMNLWLRFYLS